MLRIIVVLDPACFTTKMTVEREMLKHYHSGEEVIFTTPQTIAEGERSPDLELLAGALILSQVAQSEYNADVGIAIVHGTENGREMDAGIAELENRTLTFVFLSDKGGQMQWADEDAVHTLEPGAGFAAVAEVIAANQGRKLS